MLKTKILLLFSLYIFNSLSSVEPIDDSANLVDLSVYDGEGSMLLLWSYPDSIVVKNVKVFSRRSNQITFNLISELSGKETRYLDLDCQPNTRVFYKVEIIDIDDQIFHSDLIIPSFGSCREVKNKTLALHYNLNSLKGLAIDQILNMLKFNCKN